MSTFNIQRFLGSQLPIFLSELLIDFDQRYFPIPWRPEQWNNLDDRYVLFVAKNEITISAFSLFNISKEEDLAHLLKIAVASEERCRGLGKELLQHCLAFLSVSRIYLEVESDNVSAIKLYESCHFKRLVLKKNFYGTGRHAWAMQRVNAT